MITFRKHAAVTTQRFDSRLIRRPCGARAVPRIVVMLGVVLAAGAWERAEARHDGQGAAAQSAGSAARAEAPKPREGAQRDAARESDAAEVPVKVYVAGTPEDPLLVARIGEFPEALGDELGREFLKREFIEHFIKDVVGLGSGGRAEALKIALLPQEDAREQECAFTFGELAGRITVRLAERHVFVIVSLDHERTPVPTVRA